MSVRNVGEMYAFITNIFISVMRLYKEEGLAIYFLLLDDSEATSSNMSSSNCSSTSRSSSSNSGICQNVSTTRKTSFIVIFSVFIFIFVFLAVKYIWLNYDKDTGK